MLGLAMAPAADPVAPGRKALLSLEYERALKLLSPVAEDEDQPRPVRAEAFVLIAQAHFGIAAPQAEDRARSALRSAFRLDRNVELQDREDLSPKLVSLFDEMRPKKTEKPEKPEKPPEKPPPEKTPEKTPPEKTPEETPPLETQAGPSPWLIGAGVGGGVAVVAVGAAIGAELYLGGVPPGTSADQVKSVQTLGGAAVVVAVVAVGVAGACAVVGLVGGD